MGALDSHMASGTALPAAQLVTTLPRRQGGRARRSRATSSARKDAALLAIADALEARTPEILEANARDLEAGPRVRAVRAR